jgi:hypothetical protein
MTMKVTITVDDGGTDQGSGVTATPEMSPQASAGELSAGAAPVQPAGDATMTGTDGSAPAAPMAAGQALSAGAAPSEK